MNQPLLPRTARLVALAALASTLAACGGGGSTSTVGPTPEPPPPPTSPSEQDRINAATSTASNNAMCKDVLGPFYWEIGDGNGVRASGTVGSSPPTASTSMLVYSASKWLYAANVAEKRNGIQAEDVAYLNFTSGYSLYGNLPVCDPQVDNPTVATCHGGFDDQNAASIGKFLYDSGHMQHHAIYVMNLRDDDVTALGADLSSTLGITGLAYNIPQLASGVVATPAMYAQFLRKVLRNELKISASLGANKICANNNHPGCTAIESPMSVTAEGWNYSMGHWVEDDATVGDGTYSSAGGGGFYPWISKDKSLYGILAREDPLQSDAGWKSAECGRLIRQAFRTGQQVTGTTPTP